MKYLPLFGLKFLHGYYRDGLCSDLQVVPTAETNQLLKNHRCILRASLHEIQVLMSVDNAHKPLIPLADGTHFNFHLFIQDPDFSLFTQLDTLNQIPAPVYTNVNDDANLDLVAKKATQTERLSVVQPTANSVYVLGGNPLDGLTANDFSITGLGGVTQPTNYQAATKTITVDTTSAAKGAVFQISYPATPKMAQGTFAEVDIHYKAAWLPTASGAKVFQIAFTPKLVYWKYYVIADNGNTQFQIDNQAADTLVFSANNRTDLNQHPDVSDTVAVALAEKYPTKKRFRFVSDNAVPCQEQTRKAIRLRLATNLVLDALPNPSLQNFDFVNISSNGNIQQAPALYQIVKYYAR